MRFPAIRWRTFAFKLSDTWCGQCCEWTSLLDYWVTRETLVSLMHVFNLVVETWLWFFTQAYWESYEECTTGERESDPVPDRSMPIDGIGQFILPCKGFRDTTHTHTAHMITTSITRTKLSLLELMEVSDFLIYLVLASSFGSLRSTMARVTAVARLSEVTAVAISTVAVTSMAPTVAVASMAISTVAVASMAAIAVRRSHRLLYKSRRKACKETSHTYI